MKIVFMGTPDFAVPSLEKLIKNHQVLLVITQPDKPNKRGKKIKFSPVKELALKNNIEVFQPESLKNEDTIIKLKNIKADLFIVIAYGQILSEEVLNIPTKGCINIHGSILPKYRGPAPIHYAVLNGDKETGVTVMYMDEGLDTGDILKIATLEILPCDTTGTLYDKMKELGSVALIETLSDIEQGNISKIKQNSNEATQTRKIKKEDGYLDFSKNAQEIYNTFRGVTPVPSAYILINNLKYKIGGMEIIDTKEVSPYDIIINENELIIGCKDKSIKINAIQKPSGKMLDIKDFLRGNKIKILLN